MASVELKRNLVGTDGMAEPTYTVTAHRIVNKNPDLARATGYTHDGVNSWTPNTCCANNIPLAQADISAPVDTKAIDKTPGFKKWDVTAIVQGWLNDPSRNFGLLLNSDPSKLRDRYRSFSSNEDPVASHRPYVTVVTGPPGTAPPPPEARLGQWSSVIPAPIVQLHVHLLRDGRVLSWGRNGDPQVWDPSTGTFTAVPSPSWLFCAGHDFLPDGRLLVAGGHITDGLGLPNTNLFDPSTGSWQTGPPMAYGRWYPTNTTLPNGDVLTVAGTDQNGAVVTIPEIWNGTSWRQLTTASLSLEYYPRDFVAPDGRVFDAGEEQPSRWLDVTGTGRWTDGPSRNEPGWRSYGSAVMYEPGKILYAGGGEDPPTNTAEVIDLNDASPAWRYTGSMAYARRHMNATILPTGDVLVTGGTSAPGFNNFAGAVHVAELWNPTTGTWTTLASNQVNRLYHSTSLLLPDGRVLHTGSGDGASAPRELSYELYSPPYLFQGARPGITGATPATVAYGQTLVVETPDAASIAKVTFIRTGSVTHAFDQARRLVPLAFSPVSGGVSVTLPRSHTTAPPGPHTYARARAAPATRARRSLRGARRAPTRRCVPRPGVPQGAPPHRRSPRDPSGYCGPRGRCGDRTGSRADRIAPARQVGASLGDRHAAIVEQGGGEHAMGAGVERRGQVLEGSGPPGRDDGNPDRARDGPREGEVVAVLRAVGIHGGQQNLPRSELLQSHHPLHGFDSRRLTPAPDHDLPPPVPPPPSPLPPLPAHGGDPALSAQLVRQSRDDGPGSRLRPICGH